MDASAQLEQSTWRDLVRASWNGFKSLYIYCGANCGNNTGLVYDPYIGYQAVSEGVGYGLLMAVMMNDQPTFNDIYNAAHEILLMPTTGLMHWRVDNQNLITGETSATDADQDAAVALIFAQKRVERNEWTQHPDRPYGQRASEMIDAIYTYDVVGGRYLKPGDSWLGDGQQITNLSYFSPAWYRIFDSFQGTTRWRDVITQGYQSLQATPGSPLGLAPDWSTAAGEPAYVFCDAEGRLREDCAFEMTFDAIRVPWRIGLDCLWFNFGTACAWSQRATAFLNGLSDAQFARLYALDGTPIPLPPRATEMTLGMWLVPALATYDVMLQRRIASLLLGLSTNVYSGGYWGNEMTYYYNQSLAWFGASLLSGDFRNLYAGA